MTESHGKTTQLSWSPQLMRGWPFADTEVSETNIQLREYWRVIRRHRWLILCMTVVGLLVGGWIATTRIPIYQATATMVIEPERPNLTSVEGTVILTDSSWRFYETQYQLLKSRVVAERAAKQLKAAGRDGEMPIVRQSGPKQWWDEIRNRLLSTVASSEIEGLEMAEYRNHEHLTALIQSGVAVKGHDNSEIVIVSYDSPHPEFSAEAANAVVDAYIELGLESRLDKVKRASSWLTERIDDIRKKVVESEAALQAFQDKEGMIDLKSREELTSNKLGLLNQEVVAGQMKYSELAKRYGPKHPKIIAAKAELESAKKRLDSESRGVVKTKKKEFALAKLEREVATNRQLYELFLTRFKETDLSTDYKLTNARVIDRAQVPAAPYKPNKLGIVGIWVTLGLTLGFIFAFLREHLDNTFNSTDKIEEKLKLPVLGVVPLLKMRGVGKRKHKLDRSKDHHTESEIPERYYIQQLQSSFAEAINHIRTGVAYSNVDSPPKIILISSAVQGEGKTTLATNLALSYAQLGKTLLVDADLRKPRVAHVTGMGEGSGLVEYVAGVEPLKKCVVVDPDCSELLILRGSTTPPNPLELLSSKKLQNTIAELRSRFDHIIIDTAPVLPVSDAIVLAHLVDAVLMVVQSERTTLKMIQDALRRLEGASIKPLGIVLAQVRHRKTSYYYDGHYEYSYSGYYGHAVTRKAS